MRALLVSLLTFFSGFLSAQTTTPQNAYDFSFESIEDDKPMPLSLYKGKVILVVNTASHCGFTPQYEGLEALYQQYKDKGLVVLGVPSNDFGGQEPADNKEIATFCSKTYQVTFPMTTKVHVSGKDAHPFYLWAKKELGPLSGPKWNFHKYLVNRKGEIVDYFHSTVTPSSAKLVDEIKDLLKE